MTSEAQHINEMTSENADGVTLNMMKQMLSTSFGKISPDVKQLKSALDESKSPILDQIFEISSLNKQLLEFVIFLYKMYVQTDEKTKTTLPYAKESDPNFHMRGLIHLRDRMRKDLKENIDTDVYFKTLQDSESIRVILNGDDSTSLSDRMENYEKKNETSLFSKCCLSVIFRSLEHEIDIAPGEKEKQYANAAKNTILQHLTRICNFCNGQLAVSMFGQESFKNITKSAIGYLSSINNDSDENGNENDTDGLQDLYSKMTSMINGIDESNLKQMLEHAMPGCGDMLKQLLPCNQSNNESDDVLNVSDSPAVLSENDISNKVRNLLQQATLPRERIDMEALQQQMANMGSDHVESLD